MYIGHLLIAFMPYMLVDSLVNGQLLEYDASTDQAQAWNTFATVTTVP